MSYTTRCPACGTMFKVVPDQLKISDGWVRCGHCSDVFDATLYLEGVEPASSVPGADVGSQEQPLAASVSSALAVSHQREHDDDDGDWLLEPPPAYDGPDLTAPWATAGFRGIDGASGQDEDLSPESSDPSSADPWSNSSVPSDVDALALKSPSSFVDELKQFASGGTVTSNGPSQSDSVPTPPSVLTEPKVLPSSSEPSEVPAHSSIPAERAVEPGFVRQARRKAFWQSPATRAVLVLTSVLLGGALLMQWAVHERDRLAAQYPSSIPWLASLCRPFGCQLGPVRQIESVVIDSSNLVRRLGNFYSFDLVLKNSAPMELAVPALELSLTDARDTVVSRRVFLPTEWPGSPAFLPARGSLSVSLRLSIADSGVSSMTGYRALVFYP